MTSTQTKTKMPYSCWPIIRAMMIWETKAMAAETTRIMKAINALRLALPSPSLEVSSP